MTNPYEKQRDLAIHALGLSRGRWSYRNWFCTSTLSDDWAQWMEMCENGHAKLYRADPRIGDFFLVTKHGVDYFGLTNKVKNEDIYQ